MCKQSITPDVSKSCFLCRERFSTIVVKFCMLLLSFNLAVSVGRYCAVPDTTTSFGQKVNVMLLSSAGVC